MHPTAEAKFLFVEACEVVVRGKLHRVVIGEVGLQDDFAVCPATAGASGNLCEQLKGALCGAEIGHT